MNYEVIDGLVSSTISKIFEGKDLSIMKDNDKALEIYKYLTKTISYDFPLLDQRQKRGRVNLFQEMVDVFEKHTGICSSLSQVYKLLLESVNIESKAVICNDGNPVLHQLLIVKDKETDKWYLSDVTRGIIIKNEGLSNFSYGLDRCPSINQEILGVLPEAIYDGVLKRTIDRQEDLDHLNDFSLFDLPNNVLNNAKVK